MTCLEQVQAAAKKVGAKLSQETLREMESMLQKRMKSGITREAFAAEIKTLIDEDMTRWAEAKRAVRIMDAAKNEGVVTGYQRNKALGLSAFDYLRAVWEGGALKSGDGTNLSARGYEQTIIARHMTMFNQLDKLKDEIQSGKLDREIVQETAALQGEGVRGSSKSPAAQKAAEIFHAIKNSMGEMKRAENPLFRMLKDYYFEATHSSAKVSAVGEDAWVQSVLETHGKKSFPDLSDSEKITRLREIYQEITSGTYGSVNPGASNLSFRMARARVLIPDDWEAFHKYHSQFGDGTVAEVMMASIRKGARQISELTKFGSDREDMFKSTFSRVYEQASPKERTELTAKKEFLKAAFNTATGNVDAPAIGIGAKLVQGALTLQHVSKNSAALLSSMPDMALNLGLIQNLSGKSQIEIARDIVGGAMKAAANAEEARAIALRTGVFADAFRAIMMRELGTVTESASISDKARGAGRWITELHGKLSLIGRYHEWTRHSIGVTLSNYLSEMAQMKYADLPEVSRKGLLRYGLGEAEWSILKYGTEEADFVGRKLSLLNVESVRSIPDEAIENWMRKTGQLEGESSADVLNRGRNSLGLKLGALINEHADLGTSTATTRQRTFMYRGLSINDGWGKAYRLFFQFKSAGLVASDVLRRRYYSGAGAKGNWSGVATTTAQLLFLGALSNYAKDTALGKTPEDPRNPKFILRTVLSSGALGPAADVFISELDRSGVDQMMLRSAESFLGPAITEAGKGAFLGVQAAKSVLSDKEKFPALRTFNWAAGHIPSVFWTKAAMNYYLLNGVREDLDHGFTNRIQQRLNDTPGLFDETQEYFFLDPTRSR